MQLPPFLRVRQMFPASPELEIEHAVRNEVAKLVSNVRPMDRIAIGVGSRGISNLSIIVKHTIDAIRDLGAKPFIIPAMGSHGGATPEGQRELLASYGIVESSMGVPILDSLDVQIVGSNEDGISA
ncbi:MAG: iron-sulfur cluster binding protein, partial [bacterium]